MASIFSMQFEHEIPGTKDVICPSIEVTFTQKFDESAEEKAIFAYFSKCAGKRVHEVVKTALNKFKPAIIDTQNKIDAINKLSKNLKTQNDLNALKANLEKLQKFTITANILLKQGVKTVQGQINSELEQIEKDAIKEVKKKFKKDLRNRKVIKTCKVIVLGAITIAVAASGIAATIATAGVGLAAVVGVASVAVTIATAYGSTSALIKDDWQNETLTAERIKKYYIELNNLTEKLKEELKALETHQKKRKENLKKAEVKRNELSKKYENISAGFSQAEQKAEKAVADALRKSEIAVKKIEAVDVKIIDLLELGRQTCQYLGPLANAGKAADGVMSAMKSGASFVAEQKTNAITLHHNLKKVSGGTEGSGILMECQKILKMMT